MTASKEVQSPKPHSRHRSFHFVGSMIVTMTTSLAFFTALVISYLANDATNFSLMIGAVIANASTVVP